MMISMLTVIDTHQIVNMFTKSFMYFVITVQHWFCRDQLSPFKLQE